MTRRTTVKWLAFLALDLALAVAILVGLLSWPRQLIRLRAGTDRPDWLNVTPGCADTVPLLTHIHYSPWPLPPEQNFSAITWASLAEGRPVILKGKPNRTRYWSFTFYPLNGERHSVELPMITSEQVTLEDDGSYVITFALGPLERTKNCVSTGGMPGGIIFMRNYVPLPNSTIHLPAIYWGERLMVPAQEHAP